MFASRVNWALLDDVFSELDTGDGIVRARTALCPQGAIVSASLAEGLLGPNLGTAERVLPAVQEVAAGKDAVAVADALLDEINTSGIDLRLS